MKKIVRFFDRLEDHVRGNLSRYPIVYAFIGGVCVVIFWRGVWHTADMLMSEGGFFGVLFYEPFTIAWSVVVMLITGLFVSFFIGERIVISGLKHDKKIFEKTAEELVIEEGEIASIITHIKSIEIELAQLTNTIAKMKK
jgi:MFS superfamily sulfate permease-like transporter